MLEIKKLLADYLGVDPSDIKDDDRLTEELHMNLADLTDFANILEKKGYDLSKIDYNEVETFNEYVESITGV